MLARDVQTRFAELIASNELALPVLPEVASQVLSLVQRPDCDTARLAEILKRDPAMTAHVMAMAASPLYAGATKSSSLPQAIGRLGFAMLTQVVLAVASKARVFSVPGYEAEVKAAFQHAFATALFAQEIAKARRSTVDVAFLAGLFHDFGQPVLLQALVDLAPDASHEDVLAEIEAAHASVGARLVTKWAMPAKVAEAVDRHHVPTGCELATIVALADDFAHGRDVTQAYAASLNLYAEDLEAIGKRGADIAETVKAIA
ncbi:MAG: HDOD domain-containing protein [Deltaproteobacteria bacterium]